MTEDCRISDEAFIEELKHIPAVGDRVRLVGLDQTSSVMTAKEHRLRRELARKTAQQGIDAPEVKALEKLLEIQQMLATQARVEIQRAEIVVPERRDGVFILHGRVVDIDHVGQPGLTVSAVDQKDKPIAFTCTDERGYFKLEISSKGDEQRHSEKLFLQVSDKGKTVLFRGDEGYGIAPGRIVYREIVLDGKQVEPCPPPPVPKTVIVPNLVGQKEAKAIETLNIASLKLGERETKTVSNKVGLVLAQDPQAGSEVAVGSFVSLVIGIAKKVRVPNVVGLKLDEAIAMIEKSGLTVGSVKKRSDRRVDIVLEQEPPAEEKTTPGTAVNLVVGELQIKVRAEIVKRLQHEGDFPKIGVSAQKLNQLFEEQGINSKGQFVRLLERPDRDVLDDFKLAKLASAQAFKRILKKVLDELSPEA